MKKQTGWILTTAIMALTAVGCGDDPTGTGGDALSEAEAAEVAAAMTGTANAFAAEELGSASNANVTPAGASPLKVEEFDFEWEGTRPCEAGGSVAVEGTIDGSYDNATKIATADVVATLIQDDCGIVGEEHTFTTNGDPNLEFTADLRTVNGQPDGEQTVTLAGAFTWQDEGDRSGRCEVELTGTLDPETNTRVVEGSFCGHTLELEVEVEEA